MIKINLLYFKNLLDLVVIDFFELYNNKFQKYNDIYILSNNLNRQQFLKIFRQLFILELKKYITKFDILNPQYYCIIGSCMPKDNFLYTLSKDSLPKNLITLIENHNDFKYILREKDIKIDLTKFNSVCIDLFNEFFVNEKLLKLLGQEYKNVFFIQHKNVDCYSMFKIIKYLYGQSNCINIYKTSFTDTRQPLIAINEIIKKYASNISILNKSQQFKFAVSEIKQYIDERLKIL